VKKRRGNWEGGPKDTLNQTRGRAKKGRKKTKEVEPEGNTENELTGITVSRRSGPVVL